MISIISGKRMSISDIIFMGLITLIASVVLTYLTGEFSNLLFYGLSTVVLLSVYRFIVSYIGLSMCYGNPQPRQRHMFNFVDSGVVFILFNIIIISCTLIEKLMF